MSCSSVYPWPRTGPDGGRIVLKNTLHRLRTVRFLAAAAAVAVCGVATGAALLVAAGQQRSAQRQFDARAQLVATEVSAQIGRYVAAMTLAAAGIGATPGLTGQLYAEATEPIAGLALPGATAIAFVVSVPGDRMAGAQAYWRSRGATGLTLHPAANVREHLFRIFTTPIGRAGKPPAGLDIGQVPQAAAALRIARATGTVTVSQPYVLLADRDLPEAQRQLSFVLAAPVHATADAAGARPLLGWAVLGMHGQDFIGRALQSVSQNLVDVTLDSGNSTVARLRPAGARHRDLHTTIPVGVGSRGWTLTIAGSASSFSGANSALAPSIGFAGLLIAVLVYVLGTSHARADLRVKIATVEIEAGRVYLAQILDTIDNGVVTCDLDARLVHANRSARLGGFTDGTSLSQRTTELRLTRPDGTRLTPGDSPLLQALGGEVVDGVELCTNPADGPGRVLMVHSRPLRDPSGQPIGAVAATFDITALRQHQADLAAFAGVVAHDLKAPLTSIGGYARLAANGLGADAPGRVVTYLGRIAESTQRMGRLIDALLDYSAARDAHLELTDIDLAGLVAEVAADELDETAADPAVPAARVVIGPLPGIRADAAMVRQLLCNVIGNCVKYTVPGRATELEITADSDDAGVRVTIADRGIGIPDGRHRAVFGGFYRATEDTGPAGRGLGLAICRRIVDRHGGSITAAGNPGGGTRITFTLPAAPVAAVALSR